jgi:hypothetical protein
LKVLPRQMSGSKRAVLVVVVLVLLSIYAPEDIRIGRIGCCLGTWVSTGMRARVGRGGETGLYGFVPTRRGCAARGAFVVMCAEIGQSLRGLLRRAG